MKSSIYSNIILSIIAMCLVYNVLRDLDVFPIKEYLKLANKRHMGRIEVKIANEPLSVELSHPIDVNVESWNAGTLEVTKE